MSAVTDRPMASAPEAAVRYVAAGIGVRDMQAHGGEWSPEIMTSGGEPPTLTLVPCRAAFAPAVLPVAAGSARLPAVPRTCAARMIVDGRVPYSLPFNLDSSHMGE